jgi:hypothetical protein
MIHRVVLAVEATAEADLDLTDHEREVSAARKAAPAR